MGRIVRFNFLASNATANDLSTGTVLLTGLWHLEPTPPRKIIKESPCFEGRRRRRTLLRYCVNSQHQQMRHLTTISSRWWWWANGMMGPLRKRRRRRWNHGNILSDNVEPTRNGGNKQQQLMALLKSLPPPTSRWFRGDKKEMAKEEICKLFQGVWPRRQSGEQRVASMKGSW